MRAKVRDYKWVPDYFDDRYGTQYIKESTIPNETLNIIFDENMYIDYPSDFKEELFSFTYKYIDTPLNQSNRLSLETDINLLLEKYRAMKLLHLESDPFFEMVNYEGMVVLYKEDLFDMYDD